jgi:hypothetical protein
MACLTLSSPSHSCNLGVCLGKKRLQPPQGSLHVTAMQRTFSSTLLKQY